VREQNNSRDCGDHRPHHRLPRDAFLTASA
jgi:hypothetical protein